MNNIQRICPVSGSANWVPFFKSETGRFITGDQRISEGTLNKIICPESGVVANKNTFSDKDLDLLYGGEYELNVLGKEEHFFFTAQGPVSRSEVFFDWINPHLPEGFQSLTEIGCGEGNLLKRISDKYPKQNISGIDGNHKAARLAMDKGLKVQRKLILGEEEIPSADVFVLINVIEHVEDLRSMINSLRRSLNKNGRIIFCLPIQDYGGYDIFFYEHVWHFTSKHFEKVLSNNGLRLLYSDVNHPINHGIGLFVCEIETNEIENQDDFLTDIIQKNLDHWLENFRNINGLLEQNSFGRIAIFGGGEVSTLFLAFTNLYKQNIIACIDDTKPAGMIKHGIPVYPSEWLEKNPVDLLLLAVNKKYHQMIIDKLRHLEIAIRPLY